MTTQTKTLVHSGVQTSILPILGAAAIGLFLLFIAGFSEASVLHDAAHDSRHSLAFPCH